MTNFARALVAAGHSVTWWSSDWNHQLKKPRAGDELVRQAAREGFELRLLHAPGYPRNVSLRRLLHHELFARQIASALERDPPDLVWACFPIIPVALRLARWRRPQRTKLVFDVRDLSPDVFAATMPPSVRPAARLAMRPLQGALGRAFSRADGLVGISPAYLSWAGKLIEREDRAPPHLAIFPLGYPDDTIVSDTDRRRLENGRMVVVFAGSLGRTFDAETVIRAAELAATRGLPLVFEVAGEGERAEDLRRAASRLSTLRLHGWCGPDELKHLLAEADVGLMPYTSGATQGLPNKVFEYMANRLAILNSLPGESADLIRDNHIGENYVAGDAASLVDAAMRMDNRSASMGQLARSIFLERYDAAKISNEMVRFAERICGSALDASVPKAGAA